MKDRTSFTAGCLAPLAVWLVFFFFIPFVIGNEQSIEKKQEEQAAQEALEQERLYWEEINAIVPGDRVLGEYTFICYNEDLKTYDDKYSAWWDYKDYDYTPKSAEEVGAILYYSSVMKEEKLYYSYFPAMPILTEEDAEKYAEIWEIEELSVRLVHRGSGKTLAKKVFVAEPPERVSADDERIATVPRSDVGAWVLEKWKKK